jgi:hypothetical protein
MDLELLLLRDVRFSKFSRALAAGRIFPIARVALDTAAAACWDSGHPPTRAVSPGRADPGAGPFGPSRYKQSALAIADLQASRWLNSMGLSMERVRDFTLYD